MNIAIDGPAGAGKSTIAKRLAKEMGYIPNSSARVLKTNHSYCIGLLFEDDTKSSFQHEYFSIILSSFA